MTEALVLSGLRREAAPPRRRLGPRTASLLLRAGTLLLGILLWQAASGWRLHFIVDFENVPSPVKVAAALGQALGEPELYRHLWASLRRIAVSFGLAGVTGIATGLIIGRFRRAEDLLLPYVEVLRPIPAVAWVPLAILIWPTEESSIIFITCLGAFFPIVLNTAHGVSETPEVLVRAARSLGAGEAAVFRHVILPAALPSIGTGLVLGMGVAWFSLLAGEMISGQYGIGYFTWLAYTLVQYPRIIVGMLAIGLLGAGSSGLVRLALRPLLRWQREGAGR